MSRIANALNMYFYLSVKGKATIGQLADYLEVSERMVKKYKEVVFYIVLSNNKNLLISGKNWCIIFH